jgi:hypothetical protein
MTPSSTAYSPSLSEASSLTLRNGEGQEGSDRIVPHPLTLPIDSQDYETRIEAILGDFQVSSAGVLHRSSQESFGISPEPSTLMHQETFIPQGATPAIQRQYRLLSLRHFIHQTYFWGVPTTESQADAGEQNPTTDLQNNTWHGLDRDFYGALRQANTSRGYWNPGWCITWQEPETWGVTRQGLTLRIKPQKHLRECDRQAKPPLTLGDSLAILLPPERFEPGYYVAIGEATQDAYCLTDQEVYFHLEAAGSVALIQTLVPVLNQQAIPFQLKILYEPSRYPRPDAGVLCLQVSDYLHLQSWLKDLAKTLTLLLRPTPLTLAKAIAPGISVAEVPRASQSLGGNRAGAILPLANETFCLYQARLLAETLLTAQEQGREAVVAQRQIWQNLVEQAGLHPDAPYRYR